MEIKHFFPDWLSIFPKFDLHLSRRQNKAVQARIWTPRKLCVCVWFWSETDLNLISSREFYSVSVWIIASKVDPKNVLNDLTSCLSRKIHALIVEQIRISLMDTPNSSSHNCALDTAGPPESVNDLRVTPSLCVDHYECPKFSQSQRWNKSINMDTHFGQFLVPSPNEEKQAWNDHQCSHFISLRVCGCLSVTNKYHHGCDRLIVLWGLLCISDGRAFHVGVKLGDTFIQRFVRAFSSKTSSSPEVLSAQ